MTAKFPHVPVLIKEFVPGRNVSSGRKLAIVKVAAGAGRRGRARGVVVVGTGHLLEVDETSMTVGEHSETGKDTFDVLGVKVIVGVGGGPKVFRQQNVGDGRVFDLLLEFGLIPMVNVGDDDFENVQIIALLQVSSSVNAPTRVGDG